MRGYDAFQCYFELVNVRVSACSANRFNANGLTFGRACDREISGIAGRFNSLEVQLERTPSTETAGFPCLRASFLSVFSESNPGNALSLAARLFETQRQSSSMAIQCTHRFQWSFISDEVLGFGSLHGARMTSHCYYRLLL